MKPSSYDWKTGIVTYWDMNHVSEEMPPEGQCDWLKEDLIQACFPSGAIVDVGWYPSLCSEGQFKVAVVYDSFWNPPVYERRVHTFHDLRNALDEAIDIAVNARSQKSNAS